jgi:hypothetical protein
VIYQGGQAAQRVVVSGPSGAPRESSLDRVETRSLQAGNQFGVERRHVSMVAPAPTTTPHQNDAEASTSAYHSPVDLEVAVPLAAARAGLTLGQLAAYMEMDASNLSKVLRGNGHLSLQRLLKAPFAFWREFLPLIADPVGLTVAHEEIADIALKRFGAAVEAFVAVVPVLLRRAG